MRMLSRKSLIPFAILVFGLASPSQAKSYRNAEFGFSVQLPNRMPTCLSKNWEHEHGIVIYLTPVTCEARGGEPSIVVEGNYNAEADPNADAAARNLCSYSVANDKPHPKLAQPPSGLKIDRRRSAACQMDHDDGRIELDVIAMTKNRVPAVGDTDPDSGAPEIDYSATLTTTTDRWEQDLTTFRAVLKSIRISKP